MAECAHCRGSGEVCYTCDEPVDDGSGLCKCKNEDDVEIEKCPKCKGTGEEE